MGRPTPEQRTSRGRYARHRALRKSQRPGEPPTRQVKASAWWDEIQAFEAEGWLYRDIAHALKLSERRVRQIKAEFTAETIHIPRTGNLKHKYPEMAEFTADGFERFFNRFSGMTLAPHARRWIEAFIANRHLLLNVPPRHAKSTYFSTWIPLWLICRDRNVQIILVSETHNFAARWCKSIADQLEKNQGLIEALGRFTPDAKGDQKWAPLEGELIVRGRTRASEGAQLTLQSRGMDQQILGMEADFIIVDDPTNQEISRSEAKRESQLTHLREQVFSRRELELAEGARICVVGQRVHPKDLYGELAEQTFERGQRKGQPFWHVERHPAVSKWPEENGGVAEVLWPDRWTFEELMVSYELIGGYQAFECMYQQNPFPAGTALVKAEWWEACKDHTRPAFVGVREQATAGVSRVCAVDPSPSQYHGIVVADILYDRDQFYCVIIETKHFKSGLRDLMDDVRRIAESYGIDYFVFEQSTFSKWFFEDPVFAEFSEHFRTIKHKTSVNKNDAEYGVQSLAADFEYNRISLPYADADALRMTDKFADEVLHYIPGEKSTDDMLMALWFIKFNWKRLRPVTEHAIVKRPAQTWSFYQDIKKERTYA